MAIRAAPLKSPASLICDWIELSVLRDQKPFRFSGLKRKFDTNRESETTDTEGRARRETDTDGDGFSGEDADAFLDSVTDELGDRAKYLKDAYPFEINDSGTLLGLKDQVNEGGYIYLFCLMLTHCKADDVVDGTWVPDIDHVTRDLFQACSTLAAAGQLDGCAISFGWPRPGKEPFLVRLKQVYALFGEGKVIDVPHNGASVSPKDEEIDIIAWTPTNDQAPGTRYLLGQVASGHNWEAKSLKGPPIDRFHTMWFAPRPASDATASIFIPHAILPNGTGTRIDVMQWKTLDFGTVFDRLRLPYYAMKGIEIADAARPGFHIERRQDVPRVIEWVATQVEALRAAPNA